VNFGILPITFADPAEYDRIHQDDRLRLTGLDNLAPGEPLKVRNVTQNREFEVRHELSERQIDVLRVGGLIVWVRERLKAGEREPPDATHQAQKPQPKRRAATKANPPTGHRRGWRAPRRSALRGRRGILVRRPCLGTRHRRISSRMHSSDGGTSRDDFE
jgi:hypothetical protein